MIVYGLQTKDTSLIIHEEDGYTLVKMTHSTFNERDTSFQSIEMELSLENLQKLTECIDQLGCPKCKNRKSENEK